MDARELMRRQLDARLEHVTWAPTPREGWIRSVRHALGMTMAQLGKRLRISAPSVAELEARDARGTVSVAKLRDAADALECDLMITFVPRLPLQAMVRRQATAKVQHEQERLLHTMKLEGQEEGVGGEVDVEQAIARWSAKRTARLWD